MKYDIKKELSYLLIAIVALIIIIKIAFYKEDFIIILKTVLSFTWLFVLPGHFTMLHWKEKIGFLERLIIGTGISAAIIGIALYHIGLSGIDIIPIGFIMPLIIIVFNLLILFGKKYLPHKERPNE